MSPTAAALVCSAWSIRSHVQEPSASVIDSESVKADAVVGADSRGFDGGKLSTAEKDTSSSTPSAHLCGRRGRRGLPVDFSCKVPDFDADTELGRASARRVDRFIQFALVAARRAVASSESSR